MRTFGKWLGRILLMLLLAAVVVGLWKREEITRLMAVNSLFSADKIVSNFSNMDGAFLTVPVPRGDGETTRLPYGPETQMPPELDAWIAARNVTSLVVMHQGQIVYENYFLGTGPDDRRVSWSVAKSFLASLFGVLVEEGAIASLDDPVVQYAPVLKGSAYDGATILHVLNMASGIAFNEDYLDYNSDINRMGRVLALGGTMDDFATGLTETFAPSGSVWQYTSIDTHVLGMVIRGATGRSIPDLLSEKIIAPLGMEQAPYYLTDGVGVAFVLGGLNLTTRDYARFGQMILQGGEWNGQQVVPADWVALSTTPNAPGGVLYGYQWWMPEAAEPREYMARGIYGQYIYINERTGVVIATTGADRNFRVEGVAAENEAMFRLIANGL